MVVVILRIGRKYWAEERIEEIVEWRVYETKKKNVQNCAPAQ